MSRRLASGAWRGTRTTDPGETVLPTCRALLQAALAAAPLLLFGQRAFAAEPLKISRQFPGGTTDSGDFRDRLCRKFAQDVEARAARCKHHLSDRATCWEFLVQPGLDSLWARLRYAGELRFRAVWLIVSSSSGPGLQRECGMDVEAILPGEDR